MFFKKEIILSDQSKDTSGENVWLNGKLIITKGSDENIVWIFHGTDSFGNTTAFAIPVKGELSKANVINAAEMTAYGLRDSLAVASYNAGLSRRFRENPNDPVVAEHDKFIRDVKEQIANYGLN